MYALSWYYDPKSFPFEIFAADSIDYHNLGIIISNSIFKDDILDLLYKYEKSRADFGFPAYLGFFYFLFGSYTLPIRIINALLSSVTVIYISKIALFLHSERSAKIAGIIAMLSGALSII